LLIIIVKKDVKICLKMVMDFNYEISLNHE